MPVCPDVLSVSQDTELCVPKDSVRKAADILLSTGLFEHFPSPEEQYDLYSNYKRGFPRLRSNQGWTKPVLHLVLLPSDIGLDASGGDLIHWVDDEDDDHISYQM